MRALILLGLMAVGCGVADAATAQRAEPARPFGIRMGVGRLYAVQSYYSAPDTLFGGAHNYAIRPPNRNPAFASYVARIVPRQGLCMVAAITHPITTPANGGNLRRLFGELQGAISAKYGQPATMADSVVAGGATAGAVSPDLFMTGLATGERTYEVTWTRDAGLAAPDIEQIVLTARASNATTGRIFLYYYAPGRATCEGAVGNNDDL